MIRSMTGYGEASVETSAGRLRVEIRTVNHRYLNVNARLPAALARYEPEIRDWLRGLLERGHVNLTVRLEPPEGTAALGFSVDHDRVDAYVRLFRELSERHGIAGTPDLALLTRFNDIFVRDEEEPTGDVTQEDLKGAVVEAARAVVRMREEEGRRLEADLRERLASIERSLERIEKLAPERMESERRRLQTAIAELVGGTPVNPERLEMEIALLVERWDVSEELVRFRSHDSLFADLLAAPAEESVGKRLSFLVQEMHREANTIGSKANNAEIAHLVVAIKDEVERLREQVENVE